MRLFCSISRGRGDNPSALTSWANCYRFGGEVTDQSCTREVGHCVRPIKQISHLRERSKQVQLPNSLIEACCLKLLNKVSIGILVPAHHRLNDALGGRIRFCFCELKKVRIEVAAIACVLKEIDRRPLFVALMVSLGRCHRGPLHRSAQCDFGSALRSLEVSHVYGSEPEVTILSKDDATEVAIGSVSDCRTHHSAIGVFEPTDLLRLHYGSWHSSVARQSIESHKRDWPHLLSPVALFLNCSHSPAFNWAANTVTCLKLRAISAYVSIGHP